MGKSLFLFLCPALALGLLGTCAACARAQGKSQPPADKKDTPAEKREQAPEEKSDRPKEEFYQGKSLTEWVNLLKNKENEERGEAALALAKMGPNAQSATRPMLDLLRDPNDAYGRRLAAYVLGYNRPDPDVAAPVLLRSLKDKDPVVRRQAAIALVHFGKNARIITKELVTSLKDKNPDVRQLSAYVLGYIDPEPGDVVQPLAEAAKDKIEGVRQVVLEALKRIDPAAAAKAESSFLPPG